MSTYVTIAALAGAVLFVMIAAFQVLVAIGLPLGEVAWGGAHRILPAKLRMASAVAAVVWAGFALVVLVHGGVVDFELSKTLTGVLIWAIAAFLAVGTLMNAISRSKKERLIWTPVAAVALGLSLTVALASERIA